MKHLKYLIPFLVLSLNMDLILGQGELQREVRVVKPYTPTLRDAEKISLSPEFNDTTTFVTDFEYGISPQRYSSSFRLRPIKPARMVGLPLDRLYKSQFTLGLGNYLTPFAELTINQLRKRKSAIGLYAKHHSSSGKVKLEDDLRVDAPFSDNELELYGRQLFRRSALEGSVNGGYNSWVYYGSNPFTDTIIETDNNRQKIYNAGANIRFYSTHPDSSHLNYDFDLDYYYLQDDYTFSEHGIDFGLQLGKFIGDWYGNIDLGFEYYDRSESIDSTDNLMIRVNPNFSKSTEQWRFIIGLNSNFDTRQGQTIMGFYPHLHFEFNIVQNVLIPYMGVTGDKKVSTYRSLLEINPFLAPGFIAENEDHILAGFLGLKGRYSSKMAFDFQVKYSRINYLNSFVSKELYSNLRNQFIVDFDDVDVLNAGGEVTWNQSDKLKFVLRARYLDYNKDVWHRPNFEASLNASYNLRDKILIDANLFYTGERSARLDYSGQEPEIITLNGFFDGNLKAEYRYTKLLSFFLQLNNFSASRYEKWYGYPVQRFQVLAGFSYAL